MAESAVLVENPEEIRGKRVLVVEDGPTLTHGGMSYGAGTIAAKMHGASEIVKPGEYAVGTIKKTYAQYPHIKSVLPATGYSKAQIKDLEETIHNTPCDMVLCATPINLPRLMNISKPTLRVRYEYKDHGNSLLENVLMEHMKPLER